MSRMKCKRLRPESYSYSESNYSNVDSPSNPSI